MPGLWPTPGLSAKIRRLPDLLSRLCIPGQAARSGKVKLVDRLLVADRKFLSQNETIIHKQDVALMSISQQLTTSPLTETAGTGYRTKETRDQNYRRKQWRLVIQ
jgi:hypothetical protein